MTATQNTNTAGVEVQPQIKAPAMPESIDNGIKGVILGEAGVGKTSLLWTLPEEDTLAMDFEAGFLAVEGWKGDRIEIRQWEYARAWAALIGGANPAITDDKPYGKLYYDNVVSKLGVDVKKIAKYRNVFADSITEISRICFAWAKRQPEAFNKKGEFNLLGAYGLLGQEMIAWFKQLQHSKGKNIWCVGILNKEDEGGIISYSPQMEGSKSKLELEGIFDQIITMTILKSKDQEGIETQKRAFVTHKMNKWGYPAKDRSGRLNCVETAHLGKLMEKIRTGKRKEINWSEILDDEILY